MPKRSTFVKELLNHVKVPIVSHVKSLRMLKYIFEDRDQVS